MSLRTLAAALLVGSALAKTDIAGCTYFDDVFTPSHGYPYATRLWYVPDTGEVCEFLDCGGGRAPPKTTVPGCAAYEGTETYSPRFIDPVTLGGGEAPQTSTEAVDEVTSTATEEEGSEETTFTTTVPSTFASVTTTVDTPAETSPALTTGPEATPTHSHSSAQEESTVESSSSDDSSSSVASSSSSASGDDNAASETTSTDSSEPTNGASAPLAGVLGSCVAAGAAAWVAMM